MVFPKKLNYSIKTPNLKYKCVGLDLSAKHCGLSYILIDSPNVYLMNLKSIERNKDCIAKGYADDIVNEVNQIKPDMVICEDVYLKIFKGGKVNVREYNKILRIQGMVEYGVTSLFEYMGASHARKVIGANPHANKVEIQSLVYKMLYNKGLPIFKDVDTLREDYRKKKMCKSTFNKRADKLSKEVYKLTQLNEHKADAIVILLAHILEQ